MTLTAATNNLNLEYHFTNIINGYMGQECTRIRRTSTLDLNGNIVDDSTVETTVYGIVSVASAKVQEESGGLILAGDLVAYFMTDTDINIGTQSTTTTTSTDTIEYNDVEYQIVTRIVTASDVGVEVVDKLILRRIV